MRIRIRHIAVAIVTTFGIAIAGTGCSSSGDQSNVGSSESTQSSIEELPTDETFEPEASLVPDPTLEAESAEPTQETESMPTPDVDSDVARAANLVPCETALDIDVINATVRGISRVALDRVIVNKPNSSFIKYGETCRYILSGTGSYVAFVTSELLTDKGKDHYRRVCANGDEKFKYLTVNPILYQYYGNIQDGCTFAPKRTAPKGMLPGFVLRDGNCMVTVRLSGFDKVANDGEEVIRTVKLDPAS